MKTEEIGIGVLDVYDDESLINCTGRLAEVLKNSKVSTFVITNRKNKTKKFKYDEEINHQVPFATLRNHCISKFRCWGLKYFFILNSNVTIQDENFLENTLKISENFGTWLLLGSSKNSTIIDDTEKNANLHVNTILNTDSIFMRSGVIGSIGYFDQKYTNTKDLDVLDYINRARKMGLYPPHPFHPTIGNILSYKDKILEKIGHNDILDGKDKRVGYSYSLFRHIWQYLPMEDIKCATKNELMEILNDLQEKYGKK
jgi:hypothetical protein